MDFASILVLPAAQSGYTRRPAAATRWTATLWNAANRGQRSHLAVHLCSACQGDGEMERREAADLLPQMMGLAAGRREAGSAKPIHFFLSFFLKKKIVFVSLIRTKHDTRKLMSRKARRNSGCGET